MKCDQMKCAFNQYGGCRACQVCGAEPHEIDENCDRCWNCKSDEGVLRWDDVEDSGEIFETEKNAEQEKLIEVVAK